MTTYLLDTHILLWWLANDKNLEIKVKKLIAEPTNDILVSAVSIWEIIIKKSLNKLTVPDNLLEIIEQNNFGLLPMTAEHAIYLEKLPHIHNDPFDRLLIAQCFAEDLIFITADKIIPTYHLNCF